MAVQGPPFWALPVPLHLQESRGGRPCPTMGSGHQDPQLSRQLAHHGPVAREVVQSKGPGASAPQSVGASGQLREEQALPCAENLSSWYEVRLSEYYSMSHQRMCPVLPKLPEFLQRQNSDTTETFSEASKTYGNHSHAARFASYETTSALVTLPCPEMNMALWYTLCHHLTSVSLPIQAPGQTLFFYGLVYP